MNTDIFNSNRCRVNRDRARKWFIRHGLIPAGPEGRKWHLHHLDMTLREQNPERYVEWRIEDLIPLRIEDHVRLHGALAKWRETHPEPANKGWHLTDEQRQLLHERLVGRFTGDESPHWKREVHDHEDEIVDAYRLGRKQRDIAREFGCSQGTVQNILKTRLSQDELNEISNLRRKERGLSRRGGAHHNSKGTVQQISADGEVVAEYPTAYTAKAETGIRNIPRALKNGTTAGGFFWRRSA